MAGIMIRCIGERDGQRCFRFARYIGKSSFEYKCDGCNSGQAPYVPRSSARKGQQKQAKSKKK